MASLYILIPLAIFFICLAIVFFLWAVRTNQFDDLERRGHDILFDDDLEIPQKKPQTAIKSSHKRPSSDHD